MKYYGGCLNFYLHDVWRGVALEAPWGGAWALTVVWHLKRFGGHLDSNGGCLKFCVHDVYGQNHIQEIRMRGIEGPESGLALLMSWVKGFV